MSTPADALDQARLRPFTEEDAPTDWITGYRATTAGFLSENQGAFSRSRWDGQAHAKRRAELKTVTGQEPDWYNAVELNQAPYQVARRMLASGEYQPDGENLRPTTGRAAAWLTDYPDVVRAAARVAELERLHPGKVSTDDQLDEWVRSGAASMRALTSSESSRGPTSAQVLGTLTGAVTDPLVIATLPFGAEGAAAKGGAAILRQAAKVATVEAGIASAVELPIQVQTFQFKQDLGSPYELKDAAINVLAAGLGAGLIRGTGSVAVDLSRPAAERARAMLAQFRERQAAGEAFEPQVERAAEQLEQYVEGVDRNPFGPGVAEAAHFDAVEKASADLKALEPVRVEGVVPSVARQEFVPGGEFPGVDRFQVMDPRELGVDAARFQFKSGGDAAGVTDRLKGVERFDPKLAGQVLVYEDLAGKRWIVDGHQRRGLAERAIAAGQNPDEVKLFGYVLREADGVTASEARVVAAYKNIAEGTGSALDAAKVLREAAGGEARLPPLPPSSALVRDARGLARLGNEPFMAVVNDVVPQSYAAVVGDLIPGDREQLATLNLLARLEPANVTQARVIVEQARAVGFERRVTEDLFGDADVAENLYLERAKVADAAMRRLRQDRATFATLTERGNTIQEAGNVLDQAANKRRLDHDQETLAALARTLNQRGPISDALGAAARRVKDGERVGAVVDEFLQAVRSGLAGDAPGAARAVELTDADRASVAAVVKANADRLRRGQEPIGVLRDDDPRLQSTHLIDTPERKAFREQVAEQLLEGAKPAKKPVAFVMGGGGGSGKGTVLKALEQEGVIGKDLARLDPDEVKTKHIPEFRQLVELGEYRAGAVVHEEGGLIAKRAFDLAIERKLPLVWDRTMSRPETALAELQKLKAAGYEVHLIGVLTQPGLAWERALVRFERTYRYVPKDALTSANEGFRAHVLDYTDVVDHVLILDNNVAKGEAPILVARKSDGGTVEGVDAVRYTLLEEVRRERQAQGPGSDRGGARQAGRDGQGDQGAGEAGAQGSAAGAGGDPADAVVDLFGGATATAQAIHARQLAVAARLTGQDVPMHAGAGDLFTNANRQVDLTDLLGQDAAKLQAQEAEEFTRVVAEDGALLRVPESVIEEDGALKAVTRPVGDRVTELDAHAADLDAVKLCAVGGAGG